MNKTLSVSIAAYNAAGDLARCLDSMLQTDVADSLEIIVVNDGSKDETAEIAKEYVERYPGIVRLIDKENGGHGSTINASIRTATGKYFKIVDSDDWVDEKGLTMLVRALEQTDTDLVLNPYFIVDASTKEKSLTIPFKDSQKLNMVLKADDIDILNIPMHGITFKTDIVQKMGPVISEKCFYVDMEYTIFPLIHVHNYMCLEEPVYNYLLGTATQSMNNANLIKRRDQHLHVVKRIVDFYLTHKEHMKPAIQSILTRRLKFAILSQYKIYFFMSPMDAKKEVMEYDRWLKTHALDLYDLNVEKFFKFVKYNRLTSFWFYGLSAKLLQKLKYEPKV